MGGGGAIHPPCICLTIFLYIIITQVNEIICLWSLSPKTYQCYLKGRFRRTLYTNMATFHVKIAPNFCVTGAILTKTSLIQIIRNPNNTRTDGSPKYPCKEDVNWTQKPFRQIKYFTIMHSLLQYYVKNRKPGSSINIVGNPHEKNARND